MALLTWLVLLSSAATGQLIGPPREEPHVAVLVDFVAAFEDAEITNCPAATANPMARTLNVIMPALGLHPTGEGDSVARFAVVLPEVREGERLFVLAHIGMSDGIRWDSDTNPNGVRFGIAVDSEVRIEEAVAEPGWRLRCVELTELAGGDALVEFQTNAIDGNAAYDWALFGRPMLVRTRTAEDAASLPAGARGLVVVDQGPAGERVECREAEDLRNADVEGVAQGSSIGCAPYQYALALRGLDLNSALVTAGHAFRLVATIANTGLGHYPGGADVRMVIADGSTGPLPRVAVPPIRAGESGVAQSGEAIRWETGRARAEASLAGQRAEAVVEVQPRDVRPPASRLGAGAVRVSGKRAVKGWLEGEGCGLLFRGERGGSVHAAAYVWNGGEWQRVASLYPFWRLVVRGEDDQRLEPSIALRAIRSGAREIIVEGRAVEIDGPEWDLEMRFASEPSAQRVRVHSRVISPRGAGLLAFGGPTVLAGDRAFGGRKDFAIFPGLEYLEGDEPSSSPRDLAPPLNDRSVAAAHKVATPLMAVQGDGALAALMWDMGQEWARGEGRPAARFAAPAPDRGIDYCEMSLFAPSVGKYVEENTNEATRPFPLAAGDVIALDSWLVLDHEANYAGDSVVRGPHRGGLVLQAMRHYFECYGLPQPSAPPREWNEERRLSRQAYLGPLWGEEPPGWASHHGTEREHNLRLTPAMLLDLEAGAPEAEAAELSRRAGRARERALADEGPRAMLSSNRLPLQLAHGYVAEAARLARDRARGTLSGREDGLWVWRPQDEEHAALGIPGTHTLGQAAYPSLVALWGARYGGDAELRAEALEAMAQMALYDVPRGASMWECPQYQPDIFAAALAVRAYCEAYRQTGDASHLEHARFWGWAGLPFLYTWEMDGYPTMRYNSIGVFGSTYYTHSWIGRPVVWMGLDYAWALQELAEFDDSMPWVTIAEGITRSAEWQQYTGGESAGCYPDSWEMATNSPNPVDINPELILYNDFRLRGLSLHARSLRLGEGLAAPLLTTSADIVEATGDPASGRLRLELRGLKSLPTYAVLSPVGEPARVRGASRRAIDGQALSERARGWQYAADLRALVLKLPGGSRTLPCEITW